MNNYATFHDIKDTSVFITGGGSGIGAAITESFIQQGAKVAFVDILDSSELCDQLEERYGSRPHFMTCDITNIENLQNCIEEAVNKNGVINTLVNNAAVDNRHTIDEFSVDDWNSSLNINLRPHFFTAQSVVEGMRKLGGGSIINLSSNSYLTGNAGYPSYVAAKAGITGLTRALARELGPDKIRVNALLPGWVMTDRQKELWVTPDALKEQLNRQCLKDTLSEEDIVSTILFLASKTSQMMTGQALVVDAGVVVTG